MQRKIAYSLWHKLARATINGSLTRHEGLSSSSASVACAWLRDRLFSLDPSRRGPLPKLTGKDNEPFTRIRSLRSQRTFRKHPSSFWQHPRTRFKVPATKHPVTASAIVLFSTEQSPEQLSFRVSCFRLSGVCTQSFHRHTRYSSNHSNSFKRASRRPNSP